ncbi:hypothetical protein CDL12_23787 [Handroanthus impetiginosus]|uniref:Myb/SANT-like domain-containing protein n=1 Tax=Handroanthus impetiginosus TaxID=429701 RepID=A0A2G9GEG8_9LAMI|nr:hypothetical protein CDL12_23787 [Handroanthus impetiginosus]
MEHSATSSKCISKVGNNPKSQPCPRRLWTSEENLQLIRSLKLFRAQRWKCDGSFRGGYIGRLQKMMEERFPGCGIEVKHIKSKLQVWKNTYSLIVGILGSSSGAGASWDSNTNIIVTDSDSVWEEYIRVHPKAASFLGQPQALYETWVEIFGNDRAQGTGAVDVGDALNELLHCSSDDATSISPPLNGTQTVKSSSSNKKKPAQQSIVEIGSMMEKWMDNISTTLGNLVDNMQNPTNATSSSSTIAWDKKALRDAITDMIGLSVDKKVHASYRIAYNKDDLELFSVIIDEERYRFVRMLLLGDLN